MPIFSAGAVTAATLPTGIDAAKINTGVVSNTEFNYIDGVTSALQTQIDAKAPVSTTVTTTTVNNASLPASFTTIAASSTVTAGGDVILSNANPVIRTNTSDGSDNKNLQICSGGGAGVTNTRGACIQMSGNEVATYGGSMYLDAGEVSSPATAGAVVVRTGSYVTRTAWKYDGTVTLDATTASSWRQQMPFRGVTAHKDASQTSISGTTWVKVTFATEVLDPQSAFSSSTFTAPIAGKYRFSLTAALFADSAQNMRFALYKNGSLLTNSSQRGAVPAGGSTHVRAHVDWLVDSAVNDTWEVYCYWETGGTNCHIIYSDSDSNTGTTRLIIEFAGT